MSWRPPTKTGVGILALLVAIISLFFNFSRSDHFSPLIPNSPPPADTDSISTMAAISRTIVKKVLSQETSEVVVVPLIPLQSLTACCRELAQSSAVQ